MSYYRRAKAPGGTFFFTIVTAKRKPLLTAPDVRQALRESILHVRQTQPFDIVAWVLLPDHMHCIWTLPEGDCDYSSRIGKIKRLTSKHLGYSGERDSGLWQRRFWEHQIRDENDLIRHVDIFLLIPLSMAYVLLRLSGHIHLSIAM